MAKGQAKVGQPQLMPVKAVWCGPFNPGTADASDGCFCEDNAGYVIKPNTAANPTSSHCEWLCAHLGSAAKVPVLGYNVVVHTDGEQWFGSEWVPGEIKDWWSMVVAGSISLDHLKDDLSRIYAFDLFVQNIDRHMKNYIVRQDGADHRIYAMDHGRAWLFNGFPPPPLPMPPACHTVTAREWMKKNFSGYLSVQKMMEVIDDLRKVTIADVEKILSKQPTKWLDSSQTDAIKKWWLDGKATERLDAIAVGIGDGSLL
jgi:hypothetical protein